jgi:predicted ATP-grasp superfamily ATP-dependent carboligase
MLSKSSRLVINAQMSPDLFLIGPSTRAAAFSALRAGLQPCCVDLFADADLQQRCAATRLTERYPHGFRRFLESDLPGPWLYTGGLENLPRFVQRMARRRLLWGNEEPALTICRNPKRVADILQFARMPAPKVVQDYMNPPPGRSWLLKPLKSAGGVGIRFWSETEDQTSPRGTYRQEYIAGESLSLLFLGGGRTAGLLGITRQLVGVSWLHAAPFRYCGSIGPLDPGLIQDPSLEELGHALANECFLNGLFGVDGIYRDGTFWPVEINPRYTASVEVLEYATGRPTLGWHGHVFTEGRLPSLPSPARPEGRIIGKAILFAKQDLHFPADGPWLAELRSPRPVDMLPAYADIPAADTPIAAGRPILTFFAVADSPSVCEDVLRQMAADLDRWLFAS